MSDHRNDPNKYNRARQWIHGVLSIEGDNGEDVEATRKTIVANILGIICIICPLLMGASAVYQDHIILCILNFTVAAIMCFALAYYRETNNYRVATYTGTVIMGMLTLYVFFTGGFNQSGFVWFYPYSVGVLFLLGSKKGTATTAILFIPAVLFLLLDHNQEFLASYETNIKIRFVASFLVVFILSYLFEKTRENTHAKLMIKNTELEHTISELNRTKANLQKTQRNLESRVLERTKDLKEVNLKLQEEIRERLKIEKTLRSTVDMVKTILDGISLEIYVADYRTCNILFVNQKMKDVYGESYEGKICWKDLKGYDKPCPHCIVNQDAQKAELGREKVWEDRNQITGEWVLNHNRLIQWVDGRRVHLHVSIDITQLKKTEEANNRLQQELHQAQKMEAIGTLAGGVAHDLNNILSGITSYPDLMLLDLPEESPLRSPLETIRNSGLKAATIVADLLTLSRGGVSASEVFDPREVVNNYLCSPEFTQMISYHPGVKIETNYEAGTTHIKGSPFHLGKTVMNLVSNAAEAMPAGGLLEIAIKNKNIKQVDGEKAAPPRGQYVVLSVTDSGMGIADKDLKHIFEPFYTKKTMGRSGTGLGMTIVWNTVKDHNAHIDIKSIEKKGTTIDIYFPTATGPIEEKKKQGELADIMAGGETILVVDDVAEQREIAGGILTRLGYRVKTLASGEEAIAYLASQAVDLVILDMIMDPGLDGLETCQRILEANPAQKVIIASGFSETDKIRQTQRLGAGAYVRKPYRLEKLGATVHNILTATEAVSA